MAELRRPNKSAGPTLRVGSHLELDIEKEARLHVLTDLPEARTAPNMEMRKVRLRRVATIRSLTGSGRL